MPVPATRLFWPSDQNDFQYIRGHLKVYATEVGNWAVPGQVHFHAVGEGLSVCMPEFPVGGICAVEHIPKSYFYVTENRLLPLYLEDRWLNTTPDTCIEVGSLFQMSREFNYMLFLVNEPIIRLLSTSFGGPTSYGYGPMNPKRVISSLSEGRLWDKMYLLRKDGSVLEGQTRHNFPVILEDLSSHRVVQFDEAPIGKDIGVWVYEMLPETDRNPNQSGAGVLPGIVPDPDPTKPPRFARIRLTGMVLCTNFAVTRPPHCVIVFGLNYTFSAMFEDIARTLGQAVSWHPGSALLPVDPVPSHNQPPVITNQRGISLRRPMGTPGSGPSLTNSLLNQPMNPPPLAGQPAHWETNSVDAAPMGAQQIPALPGDDALLNYGVPGFSNVSESTPWSIEIDARPTEPYEDGSRKHGISASGDDNNNNCDNRDTN